MRVPYNKETVVYYEYMKEEDLDGGEHYNVRYYHQSSDIFFLNNPLGLPDNKDLIPLNNIQLIMTLSQV